MFTEDLSAFFDVAEGFAVAATIGAGTVNGIFDNIYVESLDFAGSRPTFTAETADVSAVTVGTSITVNSTTYTVREIHPDGTGLTMLILEE